MLPFLPLSYTGGGAGRGDLSDLDMDTKGIDGDEEDEDDDVVLISKYITIYIRIYHRGINVDHEINVDQNLKSRNKCKYSIIHTISSSCSAF
jgi:hypothetical protein